MTTAVEAGTPARGRSAGAVRPGAGVLSAYGAGSLGMGVWITVPGLLLLYFLGLQLLAFSMVPDAVAAAEAAGVSRAGAYTGVWTATEATSTALGPYLYSAALALGPYLYSAALALGGFVSSSAGAQVTQPGSAMTALLVGFTVLPAATMVVALTFQRRYRLDDHAVRP